jgi:transcriptional regulator with XRE-family HTH domain
MNTQKNTQTRQVGAEVLKRERKNKSVSQTELARRLGVSQPLVSSWESGRITLGIEDVVAIEEALQMDEGTILMPLAYPARNRNQEPTP